MNDLRTARVMHDRGTHILGMPSDGFSVGDHAWFGEPRNVEAVVVKLQDEYASGKVRIRGNPTPLFEVLPQYLPRRGLLAAEWGWPGLNGPSTALVGDPEAAR